MLTITMYLKSGAVARFEAERFEPTAADVPGKTTFTWDSGAARRHLLCVDHADVSAVVVEEAPPVPAVARTA
jgi:hypothetical protein